MHHGSLFIPATVILQTLRLHFWYLGHHFGDLGVQGDTQWTPWGADLDFDRFRMDFWTLLGPTLG